jgi:hypothetical protein
LSSRYEIPRVWYTEVPTPMTRKATKKIIGGAEEKLSTEHSSLYLRSLLHRKASDSSRHRERQLVSHYKVSSSCRRLVLKLRLWRSGLRHHAVFEEHAACVFWVHGITQVLIWLMKVGQRPFHVSQLGHRGM